MMEKQQSDIIARQLMKNIMYDNGMVDRWNPERYPQKHVDSISIAAGLFFDAHPDLLTDEHLDNMAYGEYEENQKVYGIYPEYKLLDEALNNYFN